MAYKTDVLGQFFTPPDIVETMLSLRQNVNRVLEPSAGKGAFLSCLEASAVGIEIDKDIGLSDERLLFEDFFAYSLDNRFDTIIGNPPYVRYRDIANNTKAMLPMTLFDKRSNLFLFFIAKCADHLVDGGELIFITPRDFLKSTSARQMNDMLYREGSMTHYDELGDAHIFEDATPNCAIWRWEKGRTDRHMTTGGSFHCRNGQIWCGDDRPYTQLSDFFDIKVGAVSAADDVFENERYGTTTMVCSRTATSGETRPMIYNTCHPCLKPHKDRLIRRKIKTFNDSNWWMWGRNYHHRKGERIYVNGKTRHSKPFFVSDIEAYDGSVMALFPKLDFDVSKAADALNKVDWRQLGFVCDGRALFTQRSLATAPVGI
ncbi:MAG: class I SAM-dependent methyltransferase [Alphaproteobacteria bacterium GM7ARS4]|nr:class I SAM-dependent methyltransferase [Alphaproteobacteria bacterium GM7ARS4]